MMQNLDCHAGTKDFFFEKKQQKTFANGAEPFRRDRSLMIKSFLASFFKKEVLPSC
jgi:hypothetical protein